MSPQGSALANQYESVEIAGQRIEVRRIGKLDAGSPVLVFLHEGLGCIALWRDFPDRVARATGLPALVYSRRGYGGSQPFGPALAPGFMHDEARSALPALLDHFGIDQPILVGHSDGASIALIHAGLFPHRPRAVIALAPHLFVEPVTVESIAQIAARFEGSDLPRRMGKYHANPSLTFGHWTRIWLSPQFLDWNIEAEVAAIRCPVLALQGLEDEYGTMRQVQRIGELVPGARWQGIEGCGHSPFIDQPDQVLAEISAFVGKLMA